MTREEREDRLRALASLAVMQTAPDPDPCAGYYPAQDRDGLARALGRKVLRPPPGRIPDRTVTASRLALVQDRRAGVVHDPKPTKVREKVRASASVFDDLDDQAQRGRW